jgi:CheY-like chemotaxis protein
MGSPVIAVVNDDTDFLEMMQELLSQEGYQTVMHREESTAHELIRSEQPNLVILDIRLATPEAGWKIMELMRLDPQTTQIPMIACSADSRALREKAAWLQEHRIEILGKPFDLDDLLELVQRLVGSPPGGRGAET